jgi:hypothetical protein
MRQFWKGYLISDFLKKNLTKIPHPVQSREHPKVKKFKIRVARKLDLIGPN